MLHCGYDGGRFCVKHFLSFIPHWQVGLCVVIIFSCYLQVGNLTVGDAWVKILLQNTFVCEEKIRFPFPMHHCGCDGGRFCVEHWWSGMRRRHHYIPASLFVVITYKHGLQEDFDRSQYWKIPIVQTATLLIIYIVGGFWKVLTSLNIYLTGLTAWNVFLTGVLQYIFLRFFYTILSAVNLGNIVLHRNSWLTGWCFLIGLLDASYFCLIQLCRVEVL
jgi:hypothetical protein